MIGRRSVVGLSLLGALLVCAFLAQSASAAFVPAKNTTAFTCVAGAPTDGTVGFEDAHCDKPKSANTGNFHHVAIPLNETTEIEITNAATKNETKEAEPTVLESTVGGITTKLTATTVTGTGFIHNVEPEAKVHKVTGEVTVSYTGVTVNNPTGCKVKEPITFTALFEGVEEEGGTMGMEFKPKEGTTFVAIGPFENNPSCALAGSTIKVTGTAVGTGNGTGRSSGATTVFKPADEKLKIGTVEAKFTSTTTTKMKGGNPISLTTVT